jgi:hypothetical protein
MADSSTDIPALTEALLQHPSPFKPFLPLLKAGSTAEDTIPLLTSSVLSKFLSYALVHSTKTTSQTDEALPQLYNYLSALATSSDAGLQDIAVQEYSAVLRTKQSAEKRDAQPPGRHPDRGIGRHQRPNFPTKRCSRKCPQCARRPHWWSRAAVAVPCIAGPVAAELRRRAGRRRSTRVWYGAHSESA